MIRFKKITFFCVSSLLLSACSSTPPTSFKELDQIIEPTQTTLEQRSVNWYIDQKTIRKQVLGVCFDHLSNKAEELGGEYLVEFDNDVFSKFSEYPDCENAKLADNKSMTDVALVYEHQISATETQISSPENQMYIDSMARDVANKLDALERENESTNTEGLKSLSEFSQGSKLGESKE